MVNWKESVFSDWQFTKTFNETHLGYLPMIITAKGGKVADQIQNNYAHGGGYNPLPGWIFSEENETIQYPGDGMLYPLAKLIVGDEVVRVYSHAWVCIQQPDGSIAVTRMD